MSHNASPSQFARVVDLHGRDVLRISGAADASIEVLHGEIWLTQHRDNRDIVLQAGTVFPLDDRTLAVAQARRSAIVHVRAASAPVAAVVVVREAHRAHATPSLRPALARPVMP